MQLPDSPLSLWLDTYGPYTPEPSLKGDIAVDVAVIGGGFTGIATACELRRADAALKVAVLEARTIGYGASGRNGSFGMTVVGLGFGTTAMIRGKQFLKEAHAFMERAVDTLDDLIQREKLDCDRIRPGFLRVATAPAYVARLQHEVELMKSLGFGGIDWIDAEAVRARVNSPRYIGAMWEPRLLLVNPAKLVREEKRLALKLGVSVYENTPVTEITSQPVFRLKTPEGTVSAQKLVFATNAYSHLFPQLLRKQIPAFTYMIATEPLTPAQLEPIGWKGFEGVEDARNLIHYYRRTPDNRLVMGGGPVGLTYANGLDADSNETAWRLLEEHIGFLFPSLRGVSIHSPMGRAVLGHVKSGAGAGLFGRRACGLQRRLYWPRGFADASERAGSARSSSGTQKRSARLSVRQPPRYRVAARSRYGSSPPRACGHTCKRRIGCMSGIWVPRAAA